MSFASTLRPVGLSFGAPLQKKVTNLAANDVPFHHEPNYLQLHRMLIRYQSLILLTPSASSLDQAPTYDVSPLQRKIQAELYSTLPYHRTKWLHNVESARNLLLSLERQAQSIKAPRAKKDALKDLAGKRQIIKKLRGRIEDIGREVESNGRGEWSGRNREDEGLLGETAADVLAKMGRRQDAVRKDDKATQALEEGKTISKISEETQGNGDENETDRNNLFDSSMRRRGGQGKNNVDQTPPIDKGSTSGFSNLAQTEKSLQSHGREHEDLTSALVSMAAQLKQQSRAFQFSLKQDEGFLDRAVEGLDLNLTTMEAASKNMAFLRRMSEDQGWLGRLKLYGIILGLWVIAVLLVFVGPKLRF